MRSFMFVALLAVACSGEVRAQDAAAGEKVFGVCKTCHQIGENAKNGVGPVLNGLIGRKKRPMRPLRTGPTPFLAFSRSDGRFCKRRRPSPGGGILSPHFARSLALKLFLRLRIPFSLFWFKTIPARTVGFLHLPDRIVSDVGPPITTNAVNAQASSLVISRTCKPAMSPICAAGIRLKAVESASASVAVGAMTLTVR